jgi:hypothetical protein
VWQTEGEVLTELKELRAMHYSDKWPTSLKTAEEAAEVLGLEPERLRSLADDNFAPHYRLEGGAPMFKITELKEWAAQNLMVHCEGREIPRTLHVIIEKTPDAKPTEIPRAIAAIPDLLDISEYDLGPGVYFLCYESKVTYIGQSIIPLSRIAAHRKEKLFDKAFFLPAPRADLDLIEGALIRTIKPGYNGNAPRPRPDLTDKKILSDYFGGKMDG